MGSHIFFFFKNNCVFCIFGDSTRSKMIQYGKFLLNKATETREQFTSDLNDILKFWTTLDYAKHQGSSLRDLIHQTNICSTSSCMLLYWGESELETAKDTESLTEIEGFEEFIDTVVKGIKKWNIKILNDTLIKFS